ncbi:hypothetical protein LTR75_018329, partial [Friedmanniomyces endolithicus]
ASEPKNENPGTVTSDSLAAESIQGGGSFGANSDARGPMGQSSAGTNTNNTDTSGATELPAAVDRQARDDEAQGEVGGSLSSSSGGSGSIQSGAGATGGSNQDTSSSSSSGGSGSTGDSGENTSSSSSGGSNENTSSSTSSSNSGSGTGSSTGSGSGL